MKQLRTALRSNADGIVFLLMTLFILALAGSSQAQLLGTKYLWQDSIKVTSSAVVDCTFTQKWLSLSIWFHGCAGLFKASAPDTNGITSRHYVYWPADTERTFSTATPVKRLLMKAASDSGTVYLFGYKSIRQQ